MAETARTTGTPETVRSVFEAVGPYATIGTLLVTWEVLAQLEIFHSYLLPALSVALVLTAAGPAAPDDVLRGPSGERRRGDPAPVRAAGADQSASRADQD